jgi:hypothetical protein
MTHRMKAALSMKSRVLSATILAAALALSGCAKPKHSPQERFTSTDPVLGLSDSEPGPTEVARTSEKNNEHPTIDFGDESSDEVTTDAGGMDLVPTDSKERTDEPKQEDPKKPGVKTQTTTVQKPVEKTPDDLFHPTIPRAAQDHTYVRKPIILGNGVAVRKPKAKSAKIVEDKAARGDGKDLAFCHTAKWSSSCLYGLLVYRCGQYAFPFTPFGCSAAAASFVDRLELKRIDVTLEGTTYNLPVIFTKKLVAMMENPQIRKDIVTFYELLKTSAEQKKRVDLWAWWLQEAGGDANVALDRISVLLQDTSPVQIQSEYLLILKKEGKLSAEAGAAIDDLIALNDYLTYENLNELGWRDWLSLYPEIKDIEADATPLIYHVYPMAMLARDLKRAFGTRLGSFIPFLFNTEYLNQTIDPSRWPFKHPRASTIDLKDPRIQWKMKDMYGGYAGALWGIGKGDETRGLGPFQESYAKDPFKRMRYLFWTMP